METIHAPHFGEITKAKRIKLEAKKFQWRIKIVDQALVVIICYTFYNLVQWFQR